MTLDARVVRIAPGAVRPYDADEWSGALVWVARGRLELECAGGARSGFRNGALLWLARLGVAALRNPGSEPLVLVAVTRAPQHHR